MGNQYFASFTSFGRTFRDRSHKVCIEFIKSIVQGNVTIFNSVELSFLYHSPQLEDCVYDIFLIARWTILGTSVILSEPVPLTMARILTS